jgi:hypothetical protein
MESFAAADAMLALCDIKHLNRQRAQQRSAAAAAAAARRRS